MSHKGSIGKGMGTSLPTGGQGTLFHHCERMHNGSINLPPLLSSVKIISSTTFLKLPTQKTLHDCTVTQIFSIMEYTHLLAKNADIVS